MMSKYVIRTTGRLLLGIAAMLAASATAHATVSVTLECMSNLAHGADTPGVHTLYEVDYDAGTVRNHVVDDDGAPATLNGQPYADRTFRAEITDREIKWTEDMAAGPIYRTLGRYSAQLQSDMVFEGRGTDTVHAVCRLWTPTHQTRQF